MSEVGKKYNRLTVIGLDENNKTKSKKWVCECECGMETSVSESNLRGGYIQSCGCLRLERITKHGMGGTRFYKTWKGILYRCNLKENCNYKNYGGKGIKVCERWLEFENFKKDMYKTYKEDLSIERIDNNGDYCKENCKWATQKEQCRNRRSNNNITYNGETHCVTEWAEIFGISRDILYNRFSTGWTVERAFTTPVQIHVLRKQRKLNTTN